MKLNDCGMVIIGKQQYKRPFIEWREIRKGKHRGKIEVTLLSRKFVINKSDVERFPGENELNKEDRP